MNNKLIILSIAVLTCINSQAKGTKKDSQNHGIDATNMNLNVKPGNDFFSYATEKWNEKHPMPNDMSRYGTFDLLIENNKERIKSLVENMAAENDDDQKKMSIIYKKATDINTLNEQGIKPLMEYIYQLDKISNRSHVVYAAALMSRAGIAPFFEFGVDADARNSKENLVQVVQGGLIMHQRDYYLNTDANTLKIRNAYREYGKQVFGKLYPNLNDETLTKMMNGVIRLETRMANSFKSKATLRIPENNYHKITFSQLRKTYGNIDWDLFFKENKCPSFNVIDIAQPEALACSNEIIGTENLEVIKNYLKLKVATEALPYLSEDLRKLHFDFFGKTISGQKEDIAPWKRGVNIVENYMGEALGKIYCEKYFPEAAKQRMEKLVANLQDALKDRILAQEWMSQTTKEKAVEKLSTFIVKIGYPNKWKDYSNLNINQQEPLLQTIVALRFYSSDYEIERTIGKPVDNEHWYMTPQTVNAYYNPTTNEICFPAGILQPPFFDMEADDSYNYGGIGVVIGHEMTHGFDDSGRKFDKDGNLNEWWTAEDATKFNERAQVIVDFFNNVKVLPDLNANGSLTQGENLADHGGLQVSYAAFKKVTADKKQKTEKGLTADQRFFVAYASLWAGDIRQEQIRVLTMSDPHSLGKWRVNGTLPHIDTWYDAFHITANDKMYIPKDKRLNIW